ncbi:hypothetical protein ONA00_05540 [Mycoplasmopsis cynos]|uniref:hypothetical protein n=1 Tax=Mycoplasmopsis cynos TaxID=171284 RepID=UPI0024C6C099|nr:hypothetical protein [Mycoplasmopsis cynos]WAM10764.1 hypothetical protein ONA00_05540 [Mycoplasmopsis cynos]
MFNQPQYFEVKGDVRYIDFYKFNEVDNVNIVLRASKIPTTISAQEVKDITMKY